MVSAQARASRSVKDCCHSVAWAATKFSGNSAVTRKVGVAALAIIVRATASR